MIALYMCIIMVFCMENENSTQLYHQKYCDSRHIEATNVISVEIDPGYILHYIEQPQYQSKIRFEQPSVGGDPSEIPRVLLCDKVNHVWCCISKTTGSYTFILK